MKRAPSSIQTNFLNTSAQIKHQPYNSPLLNHNRQLSNMSSMHNENVNQEQDEGFKLLEKTKQDLDDTIKDLDVKLGRVLAKQEYDYLQGYNIYVKRKEKELRDLINKLSEKNQNSTMKDDKLSTMEQQIFQLREAQIKSEKQKEDLREKIKFWKNKAEMFETEKDFLHKQTMDTKKKNKLLKIAVGQLQSEIDKQIASKDQKEKFESELQKSQFFITDLLNLANEGNANGINSKKTSPQPLNQSTNHPLDRSQLQDISTMQFSLLETSVNAGTKQKGHKRYQSVVHGVSRYANIPTENLKFEKFVDLLFKSKMQQEEITEEIKSYVKVVETNYNSTIKDLKVQNERLQKKIKNIEGQSASIVTQKNEIETLFVECIEDVRKDVMKRRLKNEIIQRKKGSVAIQTLEKGDQDAKEFEISLLKLASLAKNKIKFSDFTSKDKFNILDLFVNNEKTLIKMYEALFPQRVQAKNQSQGIKGSQYNESYVTISNTNRAFIDFESQNEDQEQNSQTELDSQLMFPKIQKKNQNESDVLRQSKYQSVRNSSQI